MAHTEISFDLKVKPNSLTENVERVCAELSAVMTNIEKSGLFNVTAIVQPNGDVDIRLVPRLKFIIDQCEIRVSEKGVTDASS